MARSNLWKLSAAQAITADDTASDYYVDLGVTTPQVGVYKPKYLCIRTNTAPTQSGDTLSIEVQIDTESTFSTPVVVMMPLVGANGAEIAASDARLSAAGAWVYRGALPYEVNQRYLRLMYRNTTSSGTITLDAWVQEDLPDTNVDQALVSNVSNP